MFDGVPLDQPFEAFLVAIIVPLLFVLAADVLERTWARALVAMLLAAKLSAIVLMTPNGFCTEFRTNVPVAGPVATIELDEPSGLMRTWDVRAHWGSGAPQCSAITRRDYAQRLRFPSWFLNVLNNTSQPHPAIAASLRGHVTVGETGTLAFDVMPAADATLTIDGQRMPSTTPGRLSAELPAGSHLVELRTALIGEDWRIVSSWNGRSLWSSALVTLAPASAWDRALWRVWPLLTAALVLLLVAGWAFSAAWAAALDPVSAAAIAALSLAMGLAAMSPAVMRFAPLLLAAVVVTPLGRRQPDWRSAAWLIGVPWLMFLAVLALPHVGEVTLYSRGDDWLTYQVSAYRIYLQGYWIEAGEKLFYYQPFYRWIAGALHVIFGDSSVGEIVWDGEGLLIGALFAFALCRPWTTGQGALAAAVLTLALFTVTPIWYLIGRGLAEISAAAFAWIAALLLLRSRTSSAGVAFAAGVFGVLAFYTRLNHMLFAAALLVFLLPPGTRTLDLRQLRRLRAAIPPRHAAAYLATLASGVALLSLRAWFYTGEISPFAGTSLALNHTGLGPQTLFSGDVWRKVFHSLFAEMIVNERFDARGVIVSAGSVAALLAAAQVPRFAQLPANIVGAVLGALAGALVAHAHGYPGRFSVHLVPLAAASAVVTVFALLRRRDERGHRPAHAGVSR